MATVGARRFGLCAAFQFLVQFLHLAIKVAIIIFFIFFLRLLHHNQRNTVTLGPFGLQLFALPLAHVQHDGYEPLPLDLRLCVQGNALLASRRLFTEQCAQNRFILWPGREYLTSD